MSKQGPVYALTIPTPLSAEAMERIKSGFEADINGKLVVLQDGTTLTRLDEEWGVNRGGFPRALASPSLDCIQAI